MNVLVRAQAKLNLHLAVLSRESSGYHSIETVFHKLDLVDDVRVRLAPPRTRTLSCSVDVGSAEENLAYRAAVALLEHTHWNVGFEIQITKRIPAGGGLGGGSADAAATLHGLNALRPAPLSSEQLLTLAAGLGADVPFMVSDAVMALAWGRGERMLSLDPLPHRHVALVIPHVRVATAEAYGWLDEHRGEYVSGSRALRYWHLANWEGLVPHAGNDFEPVVARRFAAITQIIQSLRSNGAVLAGMTGSGSVLFGIFETPPDGGELEQATRCPVVVTQTASSVEAVHRID